MYIYIYIYTYIYISVYLVEDGRHDPIRLQLSTLYLIAVHKVERIVDWCQQRRQPPDTPSREYH